jgi:hypothetical protein
MAVTDLNRSVAPWPSLRSRDLRGRGIRLAILSRLPAGELDRQIAAGVDLSSSPLLATRARSLVGGRSRNDVAAGLTRGLKIAERGGQRLSAAVAPDRCEVLAARVVIGALEQRLRSSEPVDPRGVAILQTLLTDGESALYRPGEAGELGSRLRAAAAALEAPDRHPDRAAPEAGPRAEAEAR